MNFSTTCVAGFGLVSISTQAQAQTADSTHEWGVENVGAGVNTEYSERFSMISPDGLTLYFSSDRPEGLGDANDQGTKPWDMYFAQRRNLDEPFEEAFSLGPRINSPFRDHSPSFSDDGHWLFFASDRPGGCGGYDIYAAFRQDVSDPLGWQEPRNLGCELNSEFDEACPILTTDPATRKAALYLVRNSEVGTRNHDIFVSLGSSEVSAFQSPIPIDELNTSTQDAHFDPRHGLIWAFRDGGSGGGDLWETARSEDGTWSQPTNMGTSINTADDEELPSATLSGAIYFPSNRPGGYGRYDIWTAERLKR